MNNSLLADNSLLRRGFGDVARKFGNHSPRTIVYLHDDVEHIVVHHSQSDVDVKEGRRLGDNASRCKQKEDDKPFHSANLLTAVHHVNLS